MAREKVLIVDDEEDILELLDYALARNGYKVIKATTGEEALDLARSELPDLIVLDLMLPGVDGLDVCRILKSDPDAGHIPIIMLTARGDEADVITGLELGADDYITKPFSPRVLLARAKAVLRRGKLPEPGDETSLRVHDIVINPGRREVLVSGEPVELTNTEFRLLQYLAKRPGWVFTRSQIINGVRGDDYAATDRSVDVQVTGLRRKLGEAGDYIETVRGVGYRFKEE